MDQKGQFASPVSSATSGCSLSSLVCIAQGSAPGYLNGTLSECKAMAMRACTALNQWKLARMERRKEPLTVDQSKIYQTSRNFSLIFLPTLQSCPHHATARSSASDVAVAQSCRAQRSGKAARAAQNEPRFQPDGARTRPVRRLRQGCTASFCGSLQELHPRRLGVCMFLFFIRHQSGTLGYTAEGSTLTALER